MKSSKYILILIITLAIIACGVFVYNNSQQTNDTKIVDAKQKAIMITGINYPANDVTILFQNNDYVILGGAAQGTVVSLKENKVIMLPSLIGIEQVLPSEDGAIYVASEKIYVYKAGDTDAKVLASSQLSGDETYVKQAYSGANGETGGTGIDYTMDASGLHVKVYSKTKIDRQDSTLQYIRTADFNI